MKLNSALIILIAALVAGCTIGPNIKNHAPVRNGGGISVDVILRQTQTWPDHRPNATPFGVVRGEMIEIDGAGILVRGPRLTRVHYEHISQVEFPGLKRFDFPGNPPSDERLSELQLYSRFPAGTDDELIEALIRTYHLGDLVVFGVEEHGP